MRKFYTILSLFALGGLFLNSAHATEVPVVSYTLYDLTHDQLNSVHTDSEGNGIKISTNEPTQVNGARFEYLADIDNPLECFGETPVNPPLSGASYTKAILRGKTGVTLIARAPYIQIELSPGHNLAEIQISGYGSSTNPLRYSDLACAFSTSGTTNANFNNDENGVFYIDGSTCGSPTLTIPEGTKYIRLVSMDEFGGVGVAEFDVPILLYAIRFYVMKTGSGIDEKESSYTMTQTESSLEFSEPSKVAIYSLSGSSVLSVSSVDQVNLSNLPSGIYIVKATSQNGIGSLTRKIIIK